MKYVPEHNVYIDDDLVIYGNWPSRKNKFTEGKLFQLERSEALSGYEMVTAYKNGRVHNVPVHRIIAVAFIPNDDPSFKVTVDHINRIKTDNRLENLRWADYYTQNRNKDKWYRSEKRRQHGLKIGQIEKAMRW